MDLDWNERQLTAATLYRSNGFRRHVLYVRPWASFRIHVILESPTTDRANRARTQLMQVCTIHPVYDGRCLKLSQFLERSGPLQAHFTQVRSRIVETTTMVAPGYRTRLWYCRKLDKSSVRHLQEYARALYTRTIRRCLWSD